MVVALKAFQLTFSAKELRPWLPFGEDRRSAVAGWLGQQIAEDYVSDAYMYVGHLEVH